MQRLYCPDHPGTTLSPVPALAAAAAVTSRVRLGALVMNAGVREPFDVAADAASLDVISGGRAVLGLGAGHTPAEWEYYGRTRPGPAERVDRLIEVADAARRLLDGSTVTVRGKHVALDDAVLECPRPVQSRVPLLVGGNNSRLLRYAGQHADIVGLSGLGKTRADGHSHEVRWTPAEIERHLDAVRDGVEDGPGPQLEALVQYVEITDDAERAAAALLDRFDVDSMTPAELLDAPFALIGTVTEIADHVRAQERRRGIGGYAVRADSIDALERIQRALTQ